MPTFDYDATDSSGNPTSGQMEAEDAKQLFAQLEAMGLRVRTIREVAPTHAAETNHETGQEAAAALSREPHGRLSASDIRQLSEQLADLTQAGLPLAPGLEAFAKELPAGRLRRSVRGIVRRLERGDDLEAVLRSHKFPDDLLALLRAGVRTGNTGQVLGRYVTHARQFVEVKRRTAVMFGYPVILLLLAFCVFVAFLVLVVPEFKVIYQDFEVDLPAMTNSLIWLADVAIEFGPFLLMMLIGLLAMCWAGFRFGLGGIPQRRFVYAMPLVGSILRYVSMARFSHLLAMMIEDGVPFPEALRLAGCAVRDAELSRAADRLAERCAAGETAAQAAGEFSGFPSTFVQAVRWEQHADALPSLLRALADMYEARIKDQAVLLATFCEPLMIIFTGGLLGYLVLGLFSPLISLISNLSG